MEDTEDVHNDGNVPSRPLTPKERVEIEMNELGNKIEKLSDFFGSENYPKISGIQQSLLKSQLSVMKTYHDILADRLHSWD